MEMESIDNSMSLLAASDEMFNHVCRPCKMTGGNIIEAKQYCSDCSEYLCDTCVEFHKKLPLLKTHKLLSADTVTVENCRRLTVYCGCNKNQDVTFYCEEHAEVICNPCKDFKHHNCKTSPIQEKSLEYTTGNIESIIFSTKSLKKKYYQLKQENSGNKKDIRKSKDICKEEIKAFRKELDAFIDKLEQSMLAELDDLETKEQMFIDQSISILTSALQMLDTDCKMLDDAKADGRKQAMFAADVQTWKGLRDYESRLTDLKRDSRKLIISFEKNEKLHDLLEAVKTIGSLKLSEIVVDKQSCKTFLLGQTIGARREANIRLTDDKSDPWITGCVVMPNDYVVICDYRNQKLKLLGSNLVITGSCEVPDRPRDISVVDDNNVIVALNCKELQQVQISPRLQIGSAIQLDKVCVGVEVSGENIYASCHDADVREVQVLDKQGTLQRRIAYHDIWLRTSLSYISVSRNEDRKMFISDGKNDTITCMTINGSVVYKYSDTCLRGPSGLICDDNDNILVCCHGSNRVQVITAKGYLYKTILTSKDGIQRPYSIAHRHGDNTLIVGCEDLNHLLVYHLTK